MKKRFLLSSLLALSIIGCSTPMINTSQDFSDLEKEYKSFNTKALSNVYVQRMFNKYLVTTPNPTQLIRQLEFARYLKIKSDTSYFDSLKTIIVNDTSVYTKITGITEVSQKMTTESGTFGDFVRSISPLPDTPVSTTATAITSTSFTANWNSVANATGYKLYIDGSLAYTGTALSFDKTGLASGTSHTYYVQATNSGGTSTNSNTTDVTLNPAAPVATSATGISSTSFTANWNSVANATGYKLYIDGSLAYTGTALSFDKTGLTSGTSHAYYVQATNLGGTSTNSNTTDVTLNPAAPVATSATGISSTSFTANWNSVSNATGYNLYIDDVLSYTGSALTYTKSSLSPGTSHTYYVKATNSGGSGSNSNTINVTLNPAVPVAPTATSATAITSASFTANWSSVSGATGYKLIVDGGAPISLGVVTSYSVTGLTPGSNHNYYVQAVNSGGTSTNSNTISLSTNSYVGIVSILAGGGTGTPSIDGTGTNAQFNGPCGLAVDSSGNTYVTDFNNNKIRKMTSAGVVTTFAGSSTGSADNSVGTNAQFSGPVGIALDSSGNMYVADFNNNKIRKITSAGAVTTFAGSNTQGSSNGTGTSASFYHPYGIAVDSSGNVYVSDLGNNKIRKITSAGAVTTLAGSTTNSAGSTDATGASASFNNPAGLAVDSSGNVYVADIMNHKIRKITSAGVVTTFAGSIEGSADNSVATNAQFKYPYGITRHTSGNFYVLDTFNNSVRKITSAGVVTTFAPGFNLPQGIATDLSGNVYVGDSGNNLIKKIQ